MTLHINTPSLDEVYTSIARQICAQARVKFVFETEGEKEKKRGKADYKLVHILI